MKSQSLHSICVASLLAVLAMPVGLVAQKFSAMHEQKPNSTRDVRYTIQDLGVVGTNPNQPGQPFVISNNSWISGGADVGAALHAVLMAWRGR